MYFFDAIYFSSGRHRATRTDHPGGGDVHPTNYAWRTAIDIPTSPLFLHLCNTTEIISENVISRLLWETNWFWRNIYNGKFQCAADNLGSFLGEGVTGVKDVMSQTGFRSVYAWDIAVCGSPVWITSGCSSLRTGYEFFIAVLWPLFSALVPRVEQFCY